MNELDRLRQTFYEECDELLESLQRSVERLGEDHGGQAGHSGEPQSSRADDKAQAVAAAFRAAHSIKGGGGAFGSDRLVTFAHRLEAVLEAIRGGRLEASGDVVDALFLASDHLADLVAAERDGLALPIDHETDVLATLCALLGEPFDSGVVGHIGPNAIIGGAERGDPLTSGGSNSADLAFDFPVIMADGVAASPPPSSAAGTGLASLPRERRWTITFQPTADVLRAGNQPYLVLRALRDLGPVNVICHDDSLPLLETLDISDCYLWWTIELTSAATAEQIAEPFAFVATVKPPIIRSDDGLALQFDETGALVSTGASMPADQASSATLKGEPSEAARPIGSVEALIPAADGGTVAYPGGPAAAVAVRPSSSIRVDVDRIDRLVNMVGELVITQAMLAQQTQGLPEDRFPMLFQGLEDLANHTRDLQESVMAIRAQPVKTAFARLPRLVRETAQVLGKKVRLQLVGEETEVDKSVIEGLADPLMHLIRNAIDHGIEPPEVRRAAGKPEDGTVTVAAEHRSGRIVIQVFDDGAGINLDAVRKKAIAQGLMPKDAQPSDEDLHEMLFQPGFSTVDLISNISGRGVGMDVVRANVNALGGRILVRSVPGRGTAFALTLPLTLAVMDGMLLRVGGHTYVLPIANIVESLKPVASDVHTLVGRGRVLSVRGHYVPLVCLGELFQAPGATSDPAKTLVVLAEAEDGGKVALMVDSLVGQQQVVIKSLEQNFGHCEGISAATILGDGRVALILDVAGIRQMVSRRNKGQTKSPLAESDPSPNTGPDGGAGQETTQ